MASNLPPQITFQNVQPSEMVEERIRAEAAKMGTLYDQITGYREFFAGAVASLTGVLRSQCLNVSLSYSGRQSCDWRHGPMWRK